MLLFYVLYRLKHIVPNRYISNIGELDTESLPKNIKALIIDIDQTLLSYGNNKIERNVILQLERIKLKYKCCLLTNRPAKSFDIDDITNLEKETGIDIIKDHKRKPYSDGYVKALKYLQTTPGETAMIGDRVFVDVLGANNIGLYSILVKPISWMSDPIGVSIIRLFELTIYKIVILFKNTFSSN